MWMESSGQTTAWVTRGPKRQRSGVAAAVAAVADEMRGAVPVPASLAMHCGCIQHPRAPWDGMSGSIPKKP